MADSSLQPVSDSNPRLRLWPAIVIVILQWLVMTVPGLVSDNPILKFSAMMWGPMGALLLLIIWWIAASRIPWSDRVLTFLVLIATAAAAFAAYDQSFGVFGMLLYAVPVLTTAWVAWLVLSSPMEWSSRLAGLGVVFALSWGYFAALRFDGVSGEFNAALNYRWKPTDEAKFRAERGDRKPTGGTAEAVTLKPGDWPGFRGPNRDSKITGLRIDTDWEKNPPREVWRHRVGPGWSSFAVVGNRLYTQEQRDKNSEAVVCYDAETGNEIWIHLDDVRFEEPIAGPGPRATPTFADGKVFALGAKGKLNCLDAATGKLLWTRNIETDSGAELPMWGFAASPWVAHDIVSVLAGGADGKSVLGYRVADGEIAWTAGDGVRTYSSVQSAKLRGVEQLLAVSNVGVTSFEPTNGKVLWQADWDAGPQNARCIQPAIVGDTDVLIGTGMELGTRRVHLDYDGDKWKSEEVWTTPRFKPYYNDIVIHNDHIFGLDNSFLVCVSLKDGTTKWKARGYGSGQLLLLADQNQLLVLAESGEVAIVETNPEAHKEVTRFKAIEGKTWNHPVIAHGKLYVRNGAEAACFELKPAK